MKLYFPTLFLLILLLPKCHAQESNSDYLSGEQIQNIGQKYAELFYTFQLDSLHSRILNPDYKVSELKDFRRKVSRQLGDELEILNEQYGTEPWQYYFIRYSRFKKAAQPVRTLFVFDKDGRIIQFSVQMLPREAETRHWDYTTKTQLSLPFEGKWFIGWGGRTINENQHAVSKEQRFAYDFVIRHDAKTFTGDGKSNIDYYCYEQKVIAPGSGTVVEIVDEVEENIVGKSPEIHGNRIVIDHGHDEFSILGHLKKGSFVVEEGEHVERGQLLARCGNNGHSSEPHIHYHLQNSLDIDNGDGLPITFFSYHSNGVLVKNGEPKIGEYVQNYVTKQE